MANWSDPNGRAPAFSQIGDIAGGVSDAGLRSYMLSVYNYMASGVLLTGIVAMAFAASGMGVMPAPASLGAHLAQTCALEWVGTTPDVYEQFHLIYSARKVMHPLLTRLLAAAADEMLLNE